MHKKALKKFKSGLDDIEESIHDLTTRLSDLETKNQRLQTENESLKAKTITKCKTRGGSWRFSKLNLLSDLVKRVETLRNEN